jgi:hypothetical protein
MPARRRASESARPGKTVGKGTRRARAFAGFTVGALCLSVSALPATAAGNSVAPSTYVHSVCMAQNSYKSQVAAIQASSNLASATTPTEVRDRLVVFLNHIVAALNTAVTSSQRAGVPKIKNGNKIAALVVNEVTVLRNAFVKAAHAARALNPSNVKAFRSGTLAIAKLINAAGKTTTVLSGANKRYNITALEAAVAQDPTCKGLGL